VKFQKSIINLKKVEMSKKLLFYLCCGGI